MVLLGNPFIIRSSRPSCIGDERWDFYIISAIYAESPEALCSRD
jgi:hypothetical protein